MASVKAMAFLSKGAKAELWNYTPAPLPETDIVITTTHNGLCHSDIHMRDDDWSISTYPLIAGHECVGIVEKVGSKVSKFQIGDRVGYGWIGNSCGFCSACERGEENMCAVGYSGFIVNHHGGFQEKVHASAHWGFKIPDGLASEFAAPLMCAGHTVYAPLGRHTLPGYKVGVIAIGGLGHLALQFARAMGCEVTAFSAFKNQEEDSKKFGAHHFCDFTNKEEVAKLKGTMDVILNTCPAPIDYDLFLSLLGNGGKLVLIGIPATDIKVGNMALIFGQKSIVGSIVGGRQEMRKMLNIAMIGGVKPLIETMPLTKLNEAMEKVSQGKARYRVVLTTDL